jgi:cytochrome c-type biogenesis protein CcmH
MINKYLGLLVIIITISHACFAENYLTDITLERTAREIFKDIRCLVCDGQSISDSNALVAKDLKEKIRELLKQGKTKEEVEKYLSKRYGEYILFKPAFNKKNMIIWLAPMISFLIGAISILIIFRKKKNA